MDKQSGKNFEREQYQLLKRMIHKGMFFTFIHWIVLDGTRMKPLDSKTKCFYLSD